jgi:hypothetical protein
MRGFHSRARSGAIRLSSNEWKKARHFGETLSIKKRKRSGLFRLYVVPEARSDEPINE